MECTGQEVQTRQSRSRGVGSYTGNVRNVGIENHVTGIGIRIEDGKLGMGVKKKDEPQPQQAGI